MSVGEDHAATSYRVESRRFDLASFWIQALHFAVAHVVGQHDDDVWLGHFRGGCRGER